MLLKIFLYLCVGFRVAVDCQCCLTCLLVCLLVELVVDIIVDKVKNQLFHINVVLLLECEHTLMVEEEAKRACSAEVS